MEIGIAVPLKYSETQERNPVGGSSLIPDDREGTFNARLNVKVTENGCGKPYLTSSLELKY
jgi:hypothetical protein